MIELESSPIVLTDKKGVPGFSQRLNYLFDLAGTPSDTRLTWGAKRWSVVPNTVRNWIKLDTPPQNYSTLDFVVSDLLKMANVLIDKTSIIGWLYAGGTNPFETKPLAQMPTIDVMTQIKIFNLAFSLSAEKGIDLNSMPEQSVNEIINIAYSHLVENSDSANRGDIGRITPFLNELLSALPA